MMGHTLIFLGGPAPALAAPLPPADFVIAADRGGDHALALGYSVDLLVGDLDSVSAAGRLAAIEIEQHPVDKDETDLELALAAAERRGFLSITVVGSLGGRPDHALGNLLALAAQRWAGLAIEIRVAGATGWVVHQDFCRTLPEGSSLSLLALGGPAVGVQTTGLRWPLHGEILPSGTGRGLSNQVVDNQITVKVASGVLLLWALT
ncbi:MAG: thiamine diphosphokinase [Acidimicrobiales bacterium]